MSVARRLMIWLPAVALPAVILYWSAMFVGTHLPPANVPSGNTNDKLMHFAAYLGLAFGVTVTAELRRWTLTASGVFVLLAAYGACDEWLQIPVGRDCDIRDWIADLAGICTGLLLAQLVLPPLRFVRRRVAAG